MRNPKNSLLFLLALVPLANHASAESRAEVQIPVTYEELQCYGNNGLRADLLQIALEEADIASELLVPARVEIPICEACFPMCSYTQAYELLVSEEDEERALEIIGDLRVEPLVWVSRVLTEGKQCQPPPPEGLTEYPLREASLELARAEVTVVQAKQEILVTCRACNCPLRSLRLRFRILGENLAKAEELGFELEKQ